MNKTVCDASTSQPNRRVVVMGVSGSGKSSIGEMVGHALDIPYVDGDCYHPQANIDKMSRGEPLDDEDRSDWLDKLSHLIREYRVQGKSALVGCSALKKKYRDQLRAGDPHLIFLFLDGSFDVILARMQRRRHFFTTDMLSSQFKTLEVPGADEAVVRINIGEDFADVINHATDELRVRFQQDQGNL